jgi:hypothetical protein
VNFSPRILQPEAPKPQRDLGLSTLVLFKKQIIDGLASIFKTTTLNVKITNPQDESEVLRQLLSQMKLLITSIQGQTGNKAFAQKLSLKTTDLVTLNKRIEQLLGQIANKELKVITPQKQQVFGNVKVENMPTIPSMPNLQEIKGLLQQISATLANLKLEVPAFPEMKEIKIPEMPKSMSMTEGKAILKALQDLIEKIDELPRNFPEVTIPKTVSVDNFPVQKYPNPVTNMNINPLRGFAKSNAVTVPTTAVPLPGEVLAYRRGIVIYNNDASKTLYIGGSDVTTANGMPVPPLSWSPPLDAGPKLIVYGITTATTINVRVLEVSNENTGG